MPGERDDPQFDRELLRVVKGLGYPSLESMLSPDMRKTAVRITKELLQEARTKAARKSATKGSPAWSNLGKDSPSQGGRPRAPSMEGVRRRAQSWLDSLCSLEENLAVARDRLMETFADENRHLAEVANSSRNSLDFATLLAAAESYHRRDNPEQEQYYTNQMQAMRSASAVLLVVKSCADEEMPHPKDLRWIEDHLLAPSFHPLEGERMPHLSYFPCFPWPGRTPIAFLGWYAHMQALGQAEHFHFGRCRSCGRLFVSLKAGTGYCPDRPRCAAQGSPSRRKPKTQ